MFLCYGIVVATAGDQQNPQCHNTRFVQKVSGLTTVHEVDKAYGVLTLIVFNTVLQLHNFAQRCCHCWEHFANSSFGCLTASSLNFV